MLLPRAEGVDPADRERVLILARASRLLEEADVRPVPPVLEPHQQPLAVLDFCGQRELSQLLCSACGITAKTGVA